MLQKLRQESRSIITVVLFGIIIVVFVVNFGPQSGGCAARTSYAARVGGRELSDNDIHYAWTLLVGESAGGDRGRLAGFVMDRLIERELLAQEAERMGLAVPDKEVEDLILSGKIMALGRVQEVGDAFRHEGSFDFDKFQRFCRYQLRQSTRGFKEQQRRELAADKVRELIRASVRVSEDEVRRDFLDGNLTVNLEYLRFPPHRFRPKVEIAAADLDRFLAERIDEARDYYGQRKDILYSKLPRQARLRHALVRVAKDAREAEVAAARARAEALHARVAGGEDLVAVARAASEDESTRLRGGDLGWRAQDAVGLGDDLAQAALSAEPGTLLPVGRSAAGFHVVRVEALREGDVAFEDAQRDIAYELLADARARALAGEAAGRYLARLQAGETFEALFDEDPAEREAEHAEPGAAGGAAAPAAPPKLDRPGSTDRDGPFYRKRTGPFARRVQVVPGIGMAGELTSAAFSTESGALVGGKVYEETGSAFLARVVDRAEADPAEFERRKAEILQAARTAKAQQVLAALSEDLCRTRHRQGRIQVPEATIAAATGDPAAARYQPCETLAAP